MMLYRCANMATVGVMQRDCQLFLDEHSTVPYDEVAVETYQFKKLRSALAVEAGTTDNGWNGRTTRT